MQLGRNLLPPEIHIRPGEMHKFSRDLLIQTRLDLPNRGGEPQCQPPETDGAHTRPHLLNPRVSRTKAAEHPDAHSRRLILPQGSCNR